MKFFLEVQYNGIAYNGSQIQGSQPTIQLLINQALSTILRTEIETYGASRTDAEVHANGNIYQFENDKIPENLLYKLNAILPQDIAVKNIFQVNENSNARFDAISRTYHYYLHFEKNPFWYKRSFYFPFALDIAVLHQTASIIKKHTDFETFSKRNTEVYTHNCTIIESEWMETTNGLMYKVKANRFLRGMVRALVGTQLNCARGKFSIEDFEKRILAKDCALADFSVPGFGLYLEKIMYPNEILI